MDGAATTSLSELGSAGTGGATQSPSEIDNSSDNPILVESNEDDYHTDRIGPNVQGEIDYLRALSSHFENALIHKKRKHQNLHADLNKALLRNSRLSQRLQQGQDPFHGQSVRAKVQKRTAQDRRASYAEISRKACHLYAELTEAKEAIEVLRKRYQCPICLSETCDIVTACGYTFCEGCLTFWLKQSGEDGKARSCPICC